MDSCCSNGEAFLVSVSSVQALVDRSQFGLHHSHTLHITSLLKWTINQESVLKSVGESKWEVVSESPPKMQSKPITSVVETSNSVELKMASYMMW